MKLTLISLFTIIIDTTICWPFFFEKESIKDKNLHDLPFQNLNVQEKPFQNHGLINFGQKNIQENFGFGGSFVDFANQMVVQQTNRNKGLYEKAVDSCKLNINTGSFKEIDLLIGKNRLISYNRQCSMASNPIKKIRGITSDRLFLVNPYTIGFINSGFRLLNIYNVNPRTYKLKLLSSNHFHASIPFDGCSFDFESIFVIFPDQNKITRYRIETNSFMLKTSLSVSDINFAPSAISCNNGSVYVTERITNVIRVYNLELSLERIIKLDGVVLSVHKSISVANNTIAVVDGLDAIALLNDNEAQQSNKLCHIHANMNCIEDVKIYNENSEEYLVYSVDSCNNNVKEFKKDKKNETIKFKREFEVINGIAVNSVRSSAGFMAIVTHSPSKIDVINMKNCQ